MAGSGDGKAPTFQLPEKGLVVVVVIVPEILHPAVAVIEEEIHVGALVLLEGHGLVGGEGRRAVGLSGALGQGKHRRQNKAAQGQHPEGQGHKKAGNPHVRLFYCQQHQKPRQQHPQNPQQHPGRKGRKEPLEAAQQGGEIDDHQHHQIRQKARPTGTPEDDQQHQPHPQGIQEKQAEKGKNAGKGGLLYVVGVEKGTGVQTGQHYGQGRQPQGRPESFYFLQNQHRTFTFST